MTDPTRPQPTVRSTGWQSIGVAAVLGAGLGWSLFSLLEALGAPTPQLPIIVTFAIALLAAVVGFEAVRTHRALQVRREPLPARRAVMLLTLGKSCLLAGAGLAAGYAAIAVYFWSRQDAALPRERVVSSLVAVLAGLGLAVAGAFLERSCRVPPQPDPDATPPAVP